jgi:hypothetical protein
MERNTDIILRVLKRLKTAVGYQELGMTRHAMRCLDGLAELGKIGPFGLVADVLRDEFAKNRESYFPAAHALEMVACMLPSPARHAVEMTLHACYGQASEAARSANIAAGARGVKAPQPKPV